MYDRQTDRQTDKREIHFETVLKDQPSVG
jgi:hypothetical protein